MTDKARLTCPVCGSDNVKKNYYNPDDHGMRWEISYKCPQCGLQKSEEDWDRMFTKEQNTTYPTFKDQLLELTAANNVYEYPEINMYGTRHRTDKKIFFDTKLEAETEELKYLAAHPEDVRYTAAERTGLIPSKFVKSPLLDLFKNTSVLCHSNTQFEYNTIHLRSVCRGYTPYHEGYPPAPTVWELLLKLSEFGRTQLTIENNIITMTVIDKTGKGNSICCPVNHPKIKDVYINAAEAAIKLLEKVLPAENTQPQPGEQK